jgi:hypothetical protein
MGARGQAFTEDEVRRITLLLAQTDMTCAEIAARMRCSRSAIANINKKCKVRVYDGLRSSWEKPAPATLSDISGNRDATSAG